MQNCCSYVMKYLEKLVFLQIQIQQFIIDYNQLLLYNYVTMSLCLGYSGMGAPLIFLLCIISLCNTLLFSSIISFIWRILLFYMRQICTKIHNLHLVLPTFLKVKCQLQLLSYLHQTGSFRFPWIHYIDSPWYNVLPVQKFSTQNFVVINLAS